MLETGQWEICDYSLIPVLKQMTHLFKVIGCSSFYFTTQGQIALKVAGQRQATGIKISMFRLLRWLCATYLLHPFTFDISFMLARVAVDLG